ncbi:MAG: DinB family protein [Pseudonocardia sp.]|nr:DinB family protein [Pseudonocardia sp.]
MTTTETLSIEQTDLLAELAKARFFLRNTTRDLTDEQVGLRTTVSELCLGGLIKHVTEVERRWVEFIQHGPSAMDGGKDWSELSKDQIIAAHEMTFRMQPGETLASLLANYGQVARETDELVPTLDLDTAHPLPDRPWFEPRTRWSARRVLLHIIAETAQHAGHADIIREALDGAKSMA